MAEAAGASSVWARHRSCSPKRLRPQVLGALTADAAGCRSFQSRGTVARRRAHMIRRVWQFSVELRSRIY